MPCSDHPAEETEALLGQIQLLKLYLILTLTVKCSFTDNHRHIIIFLLGFSMINICFNYISNFYFYILHEKKKFEEVTPI